MFTNSFTRFFFTIIVLSAVCVACRSDAITLDQFQHQSWRAREGAPAEITALAQTKDGYLWLGTSSGLHRFDGVRFESLEQAMNISLLSDDVCALLASSDGGLWVGYRFGGVSYIRAGKITHYQRNRKDGNLFPGNGSTRAIVEDRDGVIWATASMLSVFRNGKWEAADKTLPRSNTSGLLVDRDGGIWAGLGDGVYWKKRGAPAFQKVSDRAALTFFAQAPDGMVWALTYKAGFARFDPVSGKQLNPPPGVENLLTGGKIIFDQEGNLWSASLEAAVYRLSHNAVVGGIAHTAADSGLESMTQPDGLSGGVAGAVLQDREGTIWVGTSGGLDQFRVGRVKRLQLPDGKRAVSLALAPDANGRIWLADSATGLYSADERIQSVDRTLTTVTMAYRAPSGRLWLGNEKALWVREQGKLNRISWPIQSPRITPQAAVEDGDGGLWISFAFDGVYRLYKGVWEDKTSIFDGGNTTAFTLARDLAGAVWIGYGNDTVYRIQNGKREKFDAASLELGKVLTLLPSQNELWLGGSNAVMHYDGKMFRRMYGRGGHAFKGVSGIIVTAGGDLWLNADEGIVHVTAAALSSWRSDPGAAVSYEVLDALDGVVGKPAHARPLPTAVEADDGRLWFTTGEHVMVVDPAEKLSNLLPPPVSITHVAIDGVITRSEKPIEMPSQAQRIDISFAGLSLAIPERNRYRYRLSAGIDKNWTTIVSRQSISYTNLPPGDYLFEVMASNNDGTWSDSPAQLRFTVRPAYYQTWWFRGTLLLLLCLGLWLAHHIRMQALTRRISARLQSQQMERVRIARELHDTLLQGVGSLSLMVHTAINKVDREHPVVPYLANGLKQAETVIAEGRERVARLRVNVEAGEALIDELGILGLELTDASQTRFALMVPGKARSVETQVAEECRGIAREAIWNAVQHAHASTITLIVDFGRRNLAVHVRDDGRGISPEVLAAGGCEGHWGLPGMRERAERIGGRLEVQVQNGTGVSLRVPARLAYKRS